MFPGDTFRLSRKISFGGSVRRIAGRGYDKSPYELGKLCCRNVDVMCDRHELFN